MDRLDVSSLSGVNSYADWTANAVQSGTQVVLTNGTDSVTFANTTLADFDAGDFIF